MFKCPTRLGGSFGRAERLLAKSVVYATRFNGLHRLAVRAGAAHSRNMPSMPAPELAARPTWSASGGRKWPSGAYKWAPSAARHIELGSALAARSLSRWRLAIRALIRLIRAASRSPELVCGPNCPELSRAKRSRVAVVSAVVSAVVTCGDARISFMRVNSTFVASRRQSNSPE